MAGQQGLNAPMTVVAMVNGMIGGLILVLPIMALNAGYIFTLIVIAITGFLSWYSCFLCVEHCQYYSDLDVSMLRHFNGNKVIKIIYDIIVWLSLVLIDILYLSLIVVQWEGLVPPYEYTIVNPIVNAVLLFILVFVLKYFDFGATLMALGIVSIIAYVLFLIWVVVTYDQGYNNYEYIPFGTGYINMAAAMGQAFSIQSFFIPVLKKNKNPKRHGFYVLIAYVFGTIAYYYIAYMGSVGILHRDYVAASGVQVTIEGFFPTGAWQVNIVQAIYLVHLYTVFPQFLLISKKRIFGVFCLSESQKGKVNIAQVVYFVLFIGLCLAITMVGVSISSIIDINGAVIGFFFIYLLPAVLHVKCVYFSKGKRPIPEETVKRIEGEAVAVERKTTFISLTSHKGEIAGQQRKNTFISQTTFKVGEEPLIQHQQPYTHRALQNQQKIQQHPQMHSNNAQNGLKKQQLQIGQKLQLQIGQKQQLQIGEKQQLQIGLKEQQLQNSFYYCNCSKHSYSTCRKVVDLIIMVIMVLLGVFIMVNGIMTV